MEELVRFVAQSLVEEPDKVTVFRKETRRTTILKLRVAPGDTGRVIGKGGRVANALRTLLRASDRPMAIACLRLFTFLPERPLFSVPRFRSCIALRTFCCAFFPYFAMRPPGVTPLSPSP